MTLSERDEDRLIDGLERVQRAILLLAQHVGATGWNKPLQTVLDEIAQDLRPTTPGVKHTP